MGITTEANFSLIFFCSIYNPHKKYSRCVLSWVFPSHMHRNLFPAMSRQWAGPKDTTHPYVFKALCMIHLHSWSVQDGLHDWSCYMRRKRMIFIHLSLLQPLFQLLIQLGSQRCWSLHQLALGKKQGVGSSAWKTEQFCRIILCIS